MKKKELAVGDSTEVELIFSTGHYSTRVAKSATVICNAPGMAPGLTILAWPGASPSSMKVFTVTPFELLLDSARPEQQKKAWEYSVSINNTSKETYDLKLVSAHTQYMTVDVPGGKLKPGEEKTVRIKVDKNIADEIFTKSFTIEASDSAKTRFTLPVSKVGHWGKTPASGQ